MLHNEGRVIPALFFCVEIEMSDDLNQVAPNTSTNTVTLGGVEIKIPAITIGILSEVREALLPLAAYLPKKGETPTTKPMDILKMCMEHPNETAGLVSALTQRDLDWVKSLPLDDFVRLATKAVEVNLDFFIQRLLPSVSEAMLALAKAFNAGKARATSGQTPSSN